VTEDGLSATLKTPPGERLTGQIKTLDEKVSGIGKRVENQEFLNSGVLTALIVALIAGAAKIFGWLPAA
jgi:hypothetical protein